MTLSQIGEHWEAERERCEAVDARVSAPLLIDQFLQDLRSLEEETDQLLNLAQAAALSGYSPDHLRRMRSAGTFAKNLYDGLFDGRRHPPPRRSRPRHCSERFEELPKADT